MRVSGLITFSHPPSFPRYFRENSIDYLSPSAANLPETKAKNRRDCFSSMVELKLAAGSLGGNIIVHHHFPALNHLPELGNCQTGSLLLKVSLTCSNSLLNHGWMTDTRCHMGKINGVWKDLSLIFTCQNGWTRKKWCSAYSTDAAPCQHWEPWRSPLLPAQQRCSPTILNHVLEDSQAPHLQDFYWGSLASLHHVSLCRTKWLISCVPSSPVLPQAATAITYKPCCYRSVGAQLCGSEQRICLQPWYQPHTALDVLGCHRTHRLRHEDSS